MQLKQLINESLTLRQIEQEINTHEYVAYDRERENYSVYPEEMSNKIFDTDEDDNEDGFYTICYVRTNTGFVLVANGAFGSVEDAMYRTKRIIRNEGGNVTMDANFVVIQGYKEAKELITRWGAHPTWRSVNYAPDWKPIL